MDLEIVERLGVTRARVEAAADGPSVVTVTAARSEDGTELLSHGLAQSLAAVGRSVLLVRVNDLAKKVSVSKGSGSWLRSVRECGEHAPNVLEIGGALSLEAADEAFGEFRRHFAFTIVEAPRAEKDGSALSLAGAADFVLIAVEAGRSTREEDRELAQSLRAASATTLGVVTIERKAIRGFRREARDSVTHLRSSHVDDLVSRNAPLASRLG